MTPEKMKQLVGEAIGQFYANLRQKKETAQGVGREKIKQSSHYSGTAPGQFKRDLLPDPQSFFEAQGMKLRGQGEWRMTKCVFHDDSHASLSVNVHTGAYRCHACQAAGGDVLAFHRQQTGASFIDAAKALGAWEVQHG
ncbi:CHC2 zinc finger domain-containing protein [Aquitalea magnusonii]|uniref:CHC2-type zinc finger protein n=1 Tax=Aquitalea magnusonii TaxID=332411 RepID=A0A318JKA2_9NEIS|nr:CHC2 zinc finger domain-containing protein [Aquitalea magnusonii]PXX51045.1 CHC2-type zinc finger protein [Aquitalea magnusonii]